MKQFFSNLHKYKNYIMYSAVAALKAEVNGSFLSWLWWILDPFLFMMVYSFVSIVVFGRSEPHFIPFVFVGYGAWQFFNRSVSASAKIIRGNKSILSRVYLPKYILLFSRMFKHLIQFLITLGLSIVICIVDHVHFTPLILFAPVIIAVEIVFTFGICCVVMHCGVYARDFSNIITVALKLTFYLSGVFYSIPSRIKQPYSKLLLTMNPAAMVINEMRNSIIYAKLPTFKLLFAWLVIGGIITAVGVSLIHKHEQNYVKAI